MRFFNLNRQKSKSKKHHKKKIRRPPLKKTFGLNNLEKKKGLPGFQRQKTPLQEKKVPRKKKKHVSLSKENGKEKEGGDSWRGKGKEIKGKGF